MGIFGSAGASTLGKAIGGKKFGDVLGTIGGVLGSFLPFEEGGDVPYDTKAILHKGEFVLPKGVKPTKAQRKAVKKGKAKNKNKKPSAIKNKKNKKVSNKKNSNLFV